MRLLHIGRGNSNEIVISDTTVSRQHAQLVVEDNGQVTLIDLGSSNGTFVNGRRISSPTVLQQSDIVKVGEFMLPWRQHVQAAPPSVLSTRGVGETPFVPPPPASVAAPADYPYVTPAPKSKKMLWYAMGGLVLVGILVVVGLMVFGGGGSGSISSKKADLIGRWIQADDEDNWIEFAEDGKYTEGTKEALVYDDATWEVLKTNRILIERDGVSVSKFYEMKDDDLKITTAGHAIDYQRE